jgi:hypothetical protein
MATRCGENLRSYLARPTGWIASRSRSRSQIASRASAPAGRCRGGDRASPARSAWVCRHGRRAPPVESSTAARRSRARPGVATGATFRFVIIGLTEAYLAGTTTFDHAMADRSGLSGWRDPREGLSSSCPQRGTRNDEP